MGIFKMADLFGNTSGPCIECGKETEDIWTDDPHVLPKRHYWCCNDCQPSAVIKFAEGKKMFKKKKVVKRVKKTAVCTKDETGDKDEN